MKKLLAISTLVVTLASTSVFAQGQVSWVTDNSVAVRLDQSAATAWGVAANTPVPTGNATVGDYFRASLYYAVGGPGSQPTELTSVAKTVGFNRFVAGTINGGNVTLAGVAYGSQVWFQVKAWETAYGSTYEQALSAPAANGRQAIVGTSRMWNMAISAEGSPAPSVVKLDGTGFTAFTVSVVPEPSTIALGLLGLAGLFIFRRRQ